MRIKKRLTPVKAVAIKVAGLVKRRWRASIAVAAGLLGIGTLLTGDGTEVFFLNPVSSTGQPLAGLGVGLTLLRRFSPRRRVR